MGKKNTITKEVLRQLEQADGKVSVRQLRKKAGVRDKDKFYRILDEMKGEGLISVDRDHMASLISQDDLVPAVIVSLSRGFAFALVNYSLCFKQKML